MKSRMLIALGMTFAFALPAAAGELAATDGKGRIVALRVDGEFVDIATNLTLHQPGWKASTSQEWNALDVKFDSTPGRRHWTGRIPVTKDHFVGFDETLTESDGAAEPTMKITALTDVDLEAAFLQVDVPISAFSGGSAAILSGKRREKVATLPRNKPADEHFLSASGDQVALADAAKNLSLSLAYDHAGPLAVQDNRKWNQETYGVYVTFAKGRLAKGQSAQIVLTLRATGHADHKPVNLRMDASVELYKFDGFGGDYCFALDSPVARYTLDNLRLGWARTEMKLQLWEPVNDNDSPAATNWKYLEAQDVEGGDLHRGMLVCQELQRRKVPFIMSIWWLPKWLYADTDTDASAPHVIPAGKWPELLECIGTYLQYAKRKYGIEPVAISFNESDYGVYIKLSPAHHRDMIKRVGAYLAKLGLKTKLVLGDGNQRQSGLDLISETLKDPQAMKYVAVLSFHSWGGVDPPSSRKWAAIAMRFKLPLLVAEVGYDSEWQNVGARLSTYPYALSELRLFQELLIYAWPRGGMYWELTGDYQLVNPKWDDATKKYTLTPTKRYYFYRHFCNLTPPSAYALAAASDHPKVLFTAFHGDKQTYTLHIANLGASRQATITGIPSEVKSLRAIATDEERSYQELDAVPVRDGKVTLSLPALSLVTLTTMPDK